MVRWPAQQSAEHCAFDPNFPTGAVVETIVEPDDPIFAPAVREALAKAAFLPAQAADTPLPYWIALEFVFTIDPVKPPAVR